MTDMPQKENNSILISVIIVTYNSEEDIYDCLDSIFMYNDIQEEALEVIVVDNNSHNGKIMFDKIKRIYSNRVTCLSNTHNGGYGQGNNVGLRQASAPIAMIMNPDVRLIEPVFKTAIEAFHKNPRLSMYGMQQMKAKGVPSHISFACTTMMNGYAAAILDAACVRANIYIPKLMFLNGACFFVRRDMFKEIGYFDESLFMYGEEDDIHWRMGHKFGYNFGYNKHLHYVHLTEGRKPDVKYEMKLAASSVVENAKKGFSKEKTLKYYHQKFNLQIWREIFRMILGKKDKTLYKVLAECRDHIRQKQIDYSAEGGQ